MQFKRQIIKLLLILLVFIITGWLAHQHFWNDINSLVGKFIYEHRNEHLNTAFFELTDLVSPIGYLVFFSLLSLYIFLSKSQKIGIQIFIWAVVGGVFVSLSKDIFGTVRPEEVNMLFLPEKSFSYPSGHTFSIVIMAFTLLYFLPFGSKQSQKIFGLALSVFIFLIAYSRMYLGYHWFSDIIGGLLLGWFWVELGKLILSKYEIVSEKVK